MKFLAGKQFVLVLRKSNKWRWGKLLILKLLLFPN
jgi:hypothetical protein